MIAQRLGKDGVLFRCQTTLKTSVHAKLDLFYRVDFANTKQCKTNQHALPLIVRCYCYETVTNICNLSTSLYLDEAKLFTP